MTAAFRTFALFPVCFLLSCDKPGFPAVFPEDIATVTIHPILRGEVLCTDHRRSDGMGLGDALGTDCMLAGRVTMSMKDAPGVLYRGEGLTNEDWVGWGAELLAPFDGIVESTHVNEITNAVGVKGRGRATSIVFARSDGVKVTYAHLRSIKVAPGDHVVAGQIVGTVGNNGQSTNPHTHVGAWKDRTPLQIRFDLNIKR